ncbi:MAG: hypothetical protein K2J73_11550 [Oscillospiraceae bacterium]|nr:hypothetical protein [Oscillospiraceae bacterium]
MKKLIAAAAVIIFTLIGLTACNAAKDELIRLGDCSSYAIVSDTALRNCTAEDISEIIGFFDSMEYERADKSVCTAADSVGLFAYSADNRIFGIGFGSSGDESYFSYTPDMAVTEIGADADFFGENARVYRISAIDHDEIVDLLYEFAYTAFTGTITRVGADGLYYIAEPDEGEFPQGAVEVHSDERLNFGDRVRVTLYGGVMETAPQQIHQVEISKIEDGIQSEGDIAFFDNPLPEIGEDSAVSVRYSGTDLEADPENRTVTDVGAGIRYRFDFENLTVSAEVLVDSP